MKINYTFEDITSAAPGAWGNCSPNNPPYIVHQLLTSVDGSNRIKFVVMNYNELVAFCELGLDDPQQANLWGVYTHPQHRGKGYAKAVVKAAIEAAEAHDKPAIALSVHHENEAAISLYSGLGFVRYNVDANGFYEYWIDLNNMD